MKLQTSTFYDPTNFNQDDYEQAQISRHWVKHGQCAPRDTYERIGRAIVDARDGAIDGDLLCLGTRVNTERDTLAFYAEMRGESMDIAPASDADHIGDFNKLPEDWAQKYDAVYSNAIDHATNPTATFESWLSVVKDGGILVVGFNTNDVTVNAHDCSTFDVESVSSFMNSYHVLSVFDISGYLHYCIMVHHNQ